MDLIVNIPEKYALSYTQEELKQLLKLNMAIDLYLQGKLSSGAAVEFVGGNMDRYIFLYECKKRGIEPQTYESIDELHEEVAQLRIFN